MEKRENFMSSQSQSCNWCPGGVGLFSDLPCTVYSKALIVSFVTLLSDFHQPLLS